MVFLNVEYWNFEIRLRKSKKFPWFCFVLRMCPMKLYYIFSVCIIWRVLKDNLLEQHKYKYFLAFNLELRKLSYMCLHKVIFGIYFEKDWYRDYIRLIERRIFETKNFKQLFWSPLQEQFRFFAEVCFKGIQSVRRKWIGNTQRL